MKAFIVLLRRKLSWKS